MDAFEKLVCQLFHTEGYWTETSYKVDLTKAEKAATGRPTRPRPEIDILAYSPGRREILAIECKSFLDSVGVTFQELTNLNSTSKYKMFVDHNLRQIVLDRLKLQLLERGLCAEGDSVHLCLVAGHVKNGDERSISELCQSQGWRFFEISWLKRKLQELANAGYTNEVASVVAKILLKT